MGASILAGRDRMDLDNGMRLRLLSALEVLQARREASGREVLSGLRVEEIAALAATWSRFNREENPGLTMEAEQAEDVKKN